MADSTYVFTVSAPPLETLGWLRGRANKSGEGVTEDSENAFSVTWRGAAVAETEASAELEVDVVPQETSSLVTVTIVSDGREVDALAVIQDFAGGLGDRMSEIRAADDVAVGVVAHAAPGGPKDALGLTAKVEVDSLPRPVRKTARQHMAPGETIDFAFWGVANQTLVAFPDRILLLKPGILANTAFGCRATTFYYRDITGIQINTGMIKGVLEISTPSYQARPTDYWQSWGGRGDARVQSPHATPNCIPCSKSRIERWQPYLDELRARISASKTPHSMPVTTPVPVDVGKADPPSDAFEQLRKLAELRDSGIVTESEFEAKKTEILGRI